MERSGRWIGVRGGEEGGVERNERWRGVRGGEEGEVERSERWRGGREHFYPYQSHSHLQPT